MFPIRSKPRFPNAVHPCEAAVPPFVAVRLALGERGTLELKYRVWDCRASWSLTRSQE